jgi:hypothetical protein
MTTERRFNVQENNVPARMSGLDRFKVLEYWKKYVTQNFTYFW